LPVEISIPARKKDDFQCIIAVIFSAKTGNNIAAQYVILGMHIPSETIFDAWVSSSHVYALDQGAVVTTVLLMGQDQFAQAALAPGDEITVQAAEAPGVQVRCLILDIESMSAEPGNVHVRLTLRKR
jgi:hypothetical protein